MQLCAFLHSMTTSGGFGHVKLYFGHVPSAGDPPRTCHYDDYGLDRDDRAKASALAGLEVSNQLSSDHIAGSADTSYGWEYYYAQPYKVNGERAAIMAKTLAKLDRAMQRATDSDGHAESFGQYALRVCKALGVKVYYLDDARPAGQPMPLKFVQSEVNAMTRNLAEKLRPSAA